MNRKINAFVNEWSFDPETASTYVNPHSKLLMGRTEDGAVAIRPATVAELAQAPENHRAIRIYEWLLVIVGTVGVLAATACAAFSS